MASAKADETTSTAEEVVALETRITGIEKNLEKQILALLAPGDSQSQLLEFSQYVGNQLSLADEAISATAFEKRLKDQALKLQENGRISPEARQRIATQMELISSKANQAAKKAHVARYNLKQLDKACESWITDVNEINKLDETAAQLHLAERMRLDVTRIIGKLPIVATPTPDTSHRRLNTLDAIDQTKPPQNERVDPLTVGLPPPVLQPTEPQPSPFTQNERVDPLTVGLPPPVLQPTEPQPSSFRDSTIRKAEIVDEEPATPDDDGPANFGTGLNPSIRLNIIVAEYDGWPQIQRVDPGLGQSMGLKPGDLILGVNGIKTQLNQLDAALAEARVRTHLQIDLLRKGGSRLRLTTTLR